MAQDLLKPGKGRAKGSKAVRTLAIIEIGQQAIMAGITPLEYLLDVIRRDPIQRRPNEKPAEFAARLHDDTQQRLDAAHKAAPYVHPKVATQINLDAKVNDPAERPIDVRELARDIAFLLTVADRRPDLLAGTQLPKLVN